MTNQDAPYTTMGFCATCERYTVHVCTKCREHDASMLPAIPEGLAAENARLVEENKALKDENANLRALLERAQEFANKRDVDSSANCKLLFEIAWMVWPILNDTERHRCNDGAHQQPGTDDAS